MATSTTNLGLTKPAGTDKIRIAQINGNMDILDEKIGAVGNTSLQAQLTSQNEALSKLDSNVNETTDVLADAVLCTRTTFFKTSGSSSYVGTLPSNDYKVSTFIVNIRGGGRFVIAINSIGNMATNYYNGSSWAGWKELANCVEITVNASHNDKTSWDSAYSQLSNGYHGLVRINFSGYLVIAVAVKENANWGSIIANENSNHAPFFYSVNSGTSTLDTFALKSDVTPTSISTGISGLFAYKAGKLVIIRVYDFKPSDYTNCGTLPNELIPNTPIYNTITNLTMDGTKRIGISTNGKVDVTGTNDSKYMYGEVCYFTN